jgi:hypothetical protein
MLAIGCLLPKLCNKTLVSMTKEKDRVFKAKDYNFMSEGKVIHQMKLVTNGIHHRHHQVDGETVPCIELHAVDLKKVD